MRDSNLTLKEAAQMLSVGKRAVLGWFELHGVKTETVRCGNDKRVLVKESELVKFIERHTVRPRGDFCDNPGDIRFSG